MTPGPNLHPSLSFFGKKPSSGLSPVGKPSSGLCLQFWKREPTSGSRPRKKPSSGSLGKRSVSPGRDHCQVPPLARGWSSSNQPKENASSTFTAEALSVAPEPGGAAIFHAVARPSSLQASCQITQDKS